jgi:uncharacterized protein YxjI
LRWATTSAVEDDEGGASSMSTARRCASARPFVIETPEGDQLVQVKERKLGVRKTMTIERRGKEVATVRRRS